MEFAGGVSTLQKHTSNSFPVTKTGKAVGALAQASDKSEFLHPGMAIPFLKPLQGGLRALHGEGRASSRPRGRGVAGMSRKRPVETPRTELGPPGMRFRMVLREL